jgi:protein gp37
MGANTKIEWADDSVSFWWGCTHRGPGCLNCYAESFAKRVGKSWGPSAPRYIVGSAEMTLRKLNAKANKEGRPRIVFINSMSDFFEEHDGPVADWRGNALYWGENDDMVRESAGNSYPYQYRPVTLYCLQAKAFKLFDELRDLRFLLLTKRPENIPRMWPRVGKCDQWLNKPGGIGRFVHFKNVWLGTSIANQPDADRNVKSLSKCRDLSPVLFLSAEPLIGPIDLARAGLEIALNGLDDPVTTNIDWVIAGGESGPNARDCNTEWIRSLAHQCQAAGVAFFNKQLGAKPYTHSVRDIAEMVYPNGVPKGVQVSGSYEHLETLTFKDKKGGDWNEWPSDLRVRQFPEVAHV